MNYDALAIDISLNQKIKCADNDIADVTICFKKFSMFLFINTSTIK